MNDFQKEKLKQFANDKVMFDAVFEVLLVDFTKIRPRSELGDTEEKAARFMAIQLIQETWKELEKYKQINEENTATKGQIGL